jgi:hypothetical protein
MNFETISPLREIQVIAAGRNIRELPRLRRIYGPGRRRKMKARATVRSFDGGIRDVELYWYEAHGVGRVDWKVKNKD